MPTPEQRDAYLRKTYGISHAEFEKLLASQGGGCAGCCRMGVTRSLHVDHDHKTGEVRGILCASCNSALRKLKDDPVIAANLSRYLASPPARACLGRVQIALVKPKRRKRRRVNAVRIQV